MKNMVLLVACALGVAGCADPKYRMSGDDPYSQYLLARETALTGQGPVPQIVPKARPFKAPTAAEIQGPTLWQIIERDTTRTTRSVTGGAGQGGYYDPATGQRVTASRGSGQVVAQPVAPARVAAAQPGATQPVVTQPVVVQRSVAPAAGQAGTAPITTAPVQTNSPDPLIRYAVAQNHAPGSAVYGRQGGSSEAAARACARYPNPAAAQAMFLSSGGPQQDPMGMDPDGDGFVCGWDPAPYRDGQL